MTNFTPEKCKQIALARLDVVHQWLEFRKQVQNKLQADYDFVKLHNTSNSHLYEILGKISRGSLHRWFAMLNRTEDYTKLLPQYKYSTVREYRTVLNDEEIKIFTKFETKDIITIYNAFLERDFKPRRLKNTMALLKQFLKYCKSEGIIKNYTNFYVKRLTKKNEYSLDRIIFEV